MCIRPTCNCVLCVISVTSTSSTRLGELDSIFSGGDEWNGLLNFSLLTFSDMKLGFHIFVLNDSIS